MADPVTWTFRPDWSARILERLEWRTEVLSSIVGAQQAIATRFAPRRSLEARFLAEGRERTFLDLTIERLGSTEFRVPLWFHRAKLTAAASAGATTLACDTVNREFRAGDFAMLVGPDAFTCETVEISAVTDTDLTLAAGLDNDWLAGSVIHPLRTAHMRATGRSIQTSRVSDGAIRFEIDAGEDVDGGAETLTMYQGLPVFDYKPDWAEALSTSYEWLRDEHDSETGLRVFNDTAGRAFRTTRYGIQLHGRAEQAAFRALLRRLRGKQGALWMPGHTWDVTVAAAASSGATELEVERIGLTEVGGNSPEISHLRFADGTLVEWSSLVAPANPVNERLALAAGLPRDFSAGERACFIQAAKLDQDVITLTHETDSDGAATVNLSWAAFDNSRDGAADGDYPITTATMTAGGCGCDGGNLQLPLKMTATLPNPLPLTVFGDAGLYLSLPVVFIHDGNVVGRKIDGGYNKSVIVYAINPETLAPTAFLSQVVDPGTYVGDQDFSMTFTIGLGTATLDGEFSKVGNQLSLEIFEHASELVEYTIDPFLALNTADPMYASGSNGNIRSTNGFPFFATQSSSPYHPTYSSFQWDVHLLTGPEGTRNSVPLQKFYHNSADTPSFTSMIAWGDSPATPFADAVT